jgi:hypothetical protein
MRQAQDVIRSTIPRRLQRSVRAAIVDDQHFDLVHAFQLAG